MTDSPAGAPSTAAERAFAEFCAAGLWPGLGATTAAQLTAAGITRREQVTVRALTALPRMTERRANRLVTALIGNEHLLGLVELLLPLELPARWATRLAEAVEQSGVSMDAAEALRADPWRLLALPEVTVAQADRLARSLDPDAGRLDARRGRALLEWTMARFARDGHTVTPGDDLGAAVRAFGVDLTSAVEAAVEAGTTTSGPDRSWFSPTELATAEQAIADGLRRLIHSATPWVPTAGSTEAADDTGDDALDETQRAAVDLVAGHGVSVLTGGPGTGKSRTVSAVVALAYRHGRSVALAAPTGRAAKRLEELAGAAASTVHKLLGARPVTDGGSRAGFFDHDADNPLDADLVVVDEASMLDVQLAAALISALPDGTHLLVVGDPAQLPSIGPGQVLADLLASGVVPVTELVTLYRQSEGGSIARLATAVREGTLPAVDDPTHEVVVVPARGAAEAATRVVQLITDSIPRVFGSSADQTQVVTPVHRGPAGTQALNKALKAQLNPGPGAVRGFDKGDRVVATANHADATPTGYANGEVGTVVATGDNSLRVAFSGGESEVSGRALGELLHGWAITVHRAQGSEWESVVAVLPPEAGAMLSRPLVYTALTRAKRHLSIVHAAGPAVARAVSTIGARPRRTRLVELLQAR